MAKHNYAGLVLLFLALTAIGRAQGYGPPEDDDEVDPSTAVLALRFTKTGNADVSLAFAKPPADRSQVARNLASSLHCPEQQFHSPETSGYSREDLSQWPVQKRDEYLRELAESSQRELLARCDSVLPWNGMGRDGAIDFSSLLPVLMESHLRELWVTVTLPVAPRIEYSHENLTSEGKTSLEFLLYRIRLIPGASGRIHLAYGMSPTEVNRSVAIAFAFILFPVAVAMLLRRAALAPATRDPAAVWFKYSRTLNLCTNLTFLCWVTSGASTRKVLQDYFSFVLSGGWETTLLDSLLVIIPAFLVYVACFALSYPLHVQLRATKWKRGEFLVHQLVTVGERTFPLIFILAALENIGSDVNATAAFFLAGAVAWLALRMLRMHLTKSFPHSLTTGELRDRVFALAKKAGVTVRQIFVLPTEKAQLANAYAGGNHVVMFTDYLLQHLNKREVDAVAAHEIAHLELKHIPKRVWAFYGALMLPGFLGFYLKSVFPQRAGTGLGPVRGLYSALLWFVHWSQRDFVLVLVGLMLFYLLSRHFEFAADARAITLNGDAESQITGLLKLNRLNLMPLHWAKGAGSFLTHPSTLRRTERIAALAGMPKERYKAIVDRYISQAKSEEWAVEEHYSVSAAAHPENVRSEAKKQTERLLRLSVLLLMHVVPPALVAALVQSLNVDGVRALLYYAAGTMATPLLYFMVATQLGLAARRKQRRRLLERFRREGVQIGDDAIVVGFSPGALVRFYGSNYYNWDIGILRLSGKRFAYIGEHIRFALTPDQIDAICIGQGGPSWLKFPRVYVRWKQENGTPAVFSIASLENCSIRELSKQAQRLLQLIEAFRNGRTDAGPQIANLTPPNLGDVTSRSPKELGGVRATANIVLFLLPLALLANAIAHTEALGYILGTAILTRVLELIPHWRFRDRLLEFNSDFARAAKSSN